MDTTTEVESRTANPQVSPPRVDVHAALHALRADLVDRIAAGRARQSSADALAKDVGERIQAAADSLPDEHGSTIVAFGIIQALLELEASADAPIEPADA